MSRAAVLALALAACGSSQPAPVGEPAKTAPELRTLNEAVPQLLERYDVPSVSIAFVQDGEVAWSRAWGEAAPGQPATADTLYNVSSLAKPVAGETILRLASDEELSLDEPMSAHWVDPDIADDPRHEELTPRMALSHRTGFPNWRSDDGELAFEWDPDSRNGYSGEGFQYAARFAERKLDTPFLELVEREVFEPADMTSATWSPEGAIAQSRAKDGEWLPLDMMEPYNAAAALYSTSGDYARFLVSAMEGEGLSDEMRTERVTLSQNDVDQVCPPPMREQGLCPEAMGYGLGWMVFKKTTDDPLFVHSGKDTGRRSLAMFNPDRELGIVVLTNGDDGLQIIRDVVSMLYDEPGYNGMLAAQAQFDAMN